MLDGDVELRRIERELVEAEARGDGEAIGHLHARYGEIGGYSAKARVAEVLHGLGFTDADFQRPVADFSGGWRVRLNLARALSCRADLLLLDEPTNHLDLDAVFWLENWLKNTPATLLLISHDRDFPRRRGRPDHRHRPAAPEPDQRRLFRLRTGARARLATQQASYEAQQREIAHLTRFVERFKAKGHQGAAGAKPGQDAGTHGNRRRRARRFALPFQFPPTDCAARPAAGIENASAGYGERQILDRISMVRPAAASACSAATAPANRR